MSELRWALWFFLTAFLWAGSAVSRDNSTMTLPRSARVGIVNLLDPELTHYHASRVLQESFLKTLRVSWQIDAMLAESVRQPLTQLGLTEVSVTPSEALIHDRDACFIESSVAKALPRACAQAFAQLADSQHLEALIVLAPGLNRSADAGSAVQRLWPDFLRGWGFVTEAQATRQPALFNMTQLLLVAVSGRNATMTAREWGGSYLEQWTNYAPPPDLKKMPPELLDQTKPLFAQILARQASGLLKWLTVAPNP